VLIVSILLASRFCIHGYDQLDTAAPARAGVDLQAAPQASQALANAEQAEPVPGLAGRLPAGRAEPHAVVGHHDPELPGPLVEFDLDAVGPGVLGDVDQQLAHHGEYHAAEALFERLGAAVALDPAG
jgi:hypothetical protein